MTPFYTTQTQISTTYLIYFFFWQRSYTFYKQQINNTNMKNNTKKITTHGLNLTHYLKSDKVINMKTLKNKR